MVPAWRIGLSTGDDRALGLGIGNVDSSFKLLNIRN